MWKGYAEEGKDYTVDSVVDIRKLFGNRIFDGTKAGVHTSGHADTQTLADVCKTVNPRIGVIPIHKDETLPEISEYRIFRQGKTTIENISISIQ